MGAVLLIAMVTVVLVGGSTSSGISVKEQQSQVYWIGTTPFAISTAKVTNSSITLSVSNALAEKLYLTAIEVEDDSGNNATILIPNQMLKAGKEIVLSNYSFATFNPCAGKAAGSEFEFKTVSFIYTQHSIPGIRQQGTQPLVGTCSRAIFSCGDPVSFTYSGSTVAYGTVMSQAGHCWLDRNLGASQVATASDDSAAYGDLFQWGRLDDGHQARDSETTTNLSFVDNPGHNNFIVPWYPSEDWRYPQNDNLWQGVSGTNNPCPSDWRVPNITEWQAEIDAGSWTGADSAYASPLKLTETGYRHYGDASIYDEGGLGVYWSSTVDDESVDTLYFGSDYVGSETDSRTYGFPVRCVSDTFSCGNDVSFTYRGSPVTYGTATSQAGKCFMDRNLGASQVANASDDSAAYGDLFQWGRLDDGHQARNSETTYNLSYTDNPENNKFILPSNPAWDWRYPQNDNLWQGTSQINNPCPIGWRVPTIDEWNAEIDAGGWTDSDSAYASPLKLTLAGIRDCEGAAVSAEGEVGYYWSNTVGYDDAAATDDLDFGDGWLGTGLDVRAYGFSVRCIRDYQKTVINISAIFGVTPPVTFEYPVEEITETDQYTGTVTWSPGESPFGASLYTATITLRPKLNYTLTGVTENFFTVEGATTVTNPADSGVITAVFPATIAFVIDQAAIPAIPVPVAEETPVTTIDETDQYVGTVTWSPETEAFDWNTVYTATIHLTPRNGYKLAGVAENFFTVEGATNVTNPADSGVITAVFPATATKIVIDNATILGVTVPVGGATPVPGITETDQYWGEVTWSPETEAFDVGTVYTATINLTPYYGYTLTGVAENFFTVEGATTVTNPADSGVITAVFPAVPPENGSCGSSSGQYISEEPTTDLCSTGVNTTITSNDTGWTWGCNSMHGGTNTSATACYAMQLPYVNTTIAFSSGAYTNAVAVSPDGAYAYVADGDYVSMVWVIATSNNTVVANISDINYYPQDVAVSPSGTYIYVASAYGDFWVIATSNNTLMAHTSVGWQSRHVAVSPDNAYVYVPYYYEYDDSPGNVSVINTSDNTIVATIPVGYSPNGVAVAPSGAYAYVTNGGDNKVSVIATTNNTIVSNISVGNNPKNVAVTNNSEYAYVTNYNSNTVSVIATTNNTVVATIPVGSHPQGVAVAPSDAYVYVTNYNANTVSVIDTLDNTVVATIPVGHHPHGVAVTPDGAYVYVTNQADNTVSVISTGAFYYPLP